MVYTRRFHGKVNTPSGTTPALNDATTHTSTTQTTTTATPDPLLPPYYPQTHFFYDRSLFRPRASTPRRLLYQLPPFASMIFCMISLLYAHMLSSVSGEYASYAARTSAASCSRSNCTRRFSMPRRSLATAAASERKKERSQMLVSGDCDGCRLILTGGLSAAQACCSRNH